MLYWEVTMAREYRGVVDFPGALIALDEQGEVALLPAVRAGLGAVDARPLYVTHAALHLNMLTER